MLSLQADRLRGLEVPVSTGWLLGECMEARGKQALWVRQRPEVLAALRQQAVIQSVESSNRIEGVTVPADRLRPIVLGKSRPRDRGEEELAGYRRALDWIFSQTSALAIDATVIRHLHATAQGGFSGDAGQWKQRDNEIIEFLPSGGRVVRFVPTPARPTPQAVEELCRNYRQTADEPAIPVLLTVATFIFDLLCIHPFRDGNGRVSRLLTTLLLLQHGFEVGRYVSLERIVEETRDDHSRVLGECSKGWHDGRNEIVPWWNYFLGHLRRAYQQFADQVESAGRLSAKAGLARDAILAQVGPFTLADLRGQLPGISAPQLKKVLASLKREGRVRLSGRGRGARWVVSPQAGEPPPP